MLGLISPKEGYYYKAKWICNEDRNKYRFFNFKIITDDNTYETDVGNMTGTTGNAVWETKSGIDFQPEDIVIFRGQKFNIKNIDGNRKADIKQESAFYFVKSNGNLITRLQVRKAGI